MTPHIVILGAGISGLATAWYLRKSLGSQVRLTLLEKSTRAGGWIETLHEKGFLFEQGPHSCRTKGTGQITLALIEELGLQDQVIAPSRDARNRYLYHQGRLQCLPRSLWEIPFHPLTRDWIKVLQRDWQMPKRQEEDESIHAFFTRRLGQTWTECFIDPLVSGIYAGNCRRLSLKSCFPLFDEWEQQQGSLLRGIWRQSKSFDGRSTFIQQMRRFPLFSFKEGMETLPRALAHRLVDCLHLGKAICQLNFHSKGVEIQLEEGGRIQADHVISTVSPAILSHWLPAYPQFVTQLKALCYATVVVVNLGFKQKVLPCRGFGYLVPSKEKSSVLGCVWDSCVFPQQSAAAEQECFTVMMGGMQHPEVENLTDQAVQDQVLDVLEKQMGIRVQPQIIHIKRARQAIPQYEIGYQLWKQTLLKEGRALSSAFTLSGSALTGVAVNDCIASAYSLAENIKKAL